MNIRVKDAADLIGGSIIGNPECIISGISKIQESKKGDLTFLYLPAYNKYLQTTEASAVIIRPDQQRTREELTYIIVEKPDVAFQMIIRAFFTPEVKLAGMDESASVDTSAVIGENVALGKNVVISAGCRIGSNTKIFHNTVLLENVLVGENSIIYPNVTIRENCEIGRNNIIHSGTVIGSDGFGYSPRKQGGYDKIPQIGNVILEDDVELGSNVSVDRAALGSTVIKKGSKIDNLVQIAHNVEIGENNAISAQSGIAGSTKVGNNCIFGGQVGLAGHIEISDGVMLGAQSGVSKNLTKPGKYFGYPAKEMGISLRQEGHLRNLPDYAARLKKLEKEIELLKDQIQKTSGENS